MCKNLLQLVPRHDGISAKSQIDMSPNTAPTWNLGGLLRQSASMTQGFKVNQEDNVCTYLTDGEICDVESPTCPFSLAAGMIGNTLAA